LPVLDRRDPRGRRASAGPAAVRDDAVLGDGGRGPLAGRGAARVDLAVESTAQGGVLPDPVRGAGQRPPLLRRRGGGDRAAAGGARGGRDRDRRRDTGGRGGEGRADRRVPGRGAPRPDRRRHALLPPARAPGGSRAGGVPDVLLPGRVSALPRVPAGTVEPVTEEAR